MSDKRFQVIDDGFSKWIIDTTLKEDRHEGTLYTAYDMCYKLNELYEENEQLKSDIMLIEKNADRHYEENVQLKKEKAKLTERLRECSMRLDRFNCR